MSRHLIKAFLILTFTVSASLAFSKSEVSWQRIGEDVQSTLREIKNPALNNLERKNKIMAQKKISGAHFQILLQQSGPTDEAQFAQAYQHLSLLAALSSLNVVATGQTTLESCDETRSILSVMRLDANGLQATLASAERDAQEVLNIMCGI